MTTETTANINIAIPLNKLLAWEGNVRKTDADKGIDELAASITAHGLLQSLVVRKDRRGKFAVVAGRRRLLALQALVEAGLMDKEIPVPCAVIGDDADATKISLAENVQREQMHPADEFEAFRALIDGGMPLADVAARFGVTDTVVQKRLKLANVSPTLLEAYRRGEMTLQHVMAFAVSDDHEVQERIWNDLGEWQKDDPETIRDLLTTDEITADDRRVKFVTLKAYEKAGGTVRRDLFSEGEDGVFIQDAVLLESLVTRKLEKVAASTRAEGWKWVEIRPSFDLSAWSGCERRYPEALPLPAEQQAELESLTAEFDAFEASDDLDDEQQSHFDTVTERIMELEDGPKAWTTETLAIAGAVVTLGSNGITDIRAGYIKPEDAPKTTGKAYSDAETKEARDNSAANGTAALTASLIESLTAHRSAALNAALLERPDVALAATVHALAMQVFYNGPCGDSVLQITANAAPLHRVEGSLAHGFVEAAREHWRGQLPGNGFDLFGWCLAQDGDTLRGLLTFCAAQTVNAVLLKSERSDNRRMAHAALLAEAVHLDMAAWFTPSAENYFGRISKAAIIAPLKDIKCDVAPAWTGMKKSELAALAERETAGTRWLPDLLRLSATSEAKED